MKTYSEKRKAIALILYTVICTISLLLSVIVPMINHYIHGLIILCCAVISYFVSVLCVSDRNWMDIRALFSGVWLGTIGLAALRLVDYQKPWHVKTWILLALAFVAFQIGATLGIAWGPKLYGNIEKRFKKIKFKRIDFQLHENRLFLICVITTLIGLTCFIINVLIRGYIPCFSDNPNAYVDFYTKFHIFSTAATAVSGLCFYCIRTQPLKLWKKVILTLCIFYLVIAFPILVVSRGVLMVAALSLIISIFYTCGKRFLALVLSIIVIMGVYLFASTLRNYTDQQLSTIFQPSEITTPNKPTDPNNPANPGDDPFGSTSVVFQLSPKMSFLYGYVTVSHDNLNEAVENIQGYTWGVRQLVPINVILQSDWIAQQNVDAEYYTVTPNLLTTNLIGDFYYDFGMVGVAFFMVLWSLVFGIVQAVADKNKGPFSLLALGNVMTPVALCFFDSWMSIFNFWMFWGVALLLAIATYFTIKKKQK